MANKKLYHEDVLQMLFADSDPEGEYLPFGNDDQSSNDRASPGTSFQRNGAAVQGESVHEAQTSDNFDPLPNGDGGGRGERGRRRAVALWAHWAPLAPRCWWSARLRRLFWSRAL